MSGLNISLIFPVYPTSISLIFPATMKQSVVPATTDFSNTKKEAWVLMYVHFCFVAVPFMREKLMAEGNSGWSDKEQHSQFRALGVFTQDFLFLSSD